MANVRPIIRAPDLDSPGSDELWSAFQPLDLPENIRLTVQTTFMSPQILDDIVFSVTVDVPAYSSPTADNEIIENPTDDFVCCGSDFDGTR